VDKALDLHLILDNYSTHKTKQVQNWLKRHTRFKLHFIPTSSSWLNFYVSGPQKGFLDGIDHHFRLFDHQEMSTIGHVFDRVVVVPACDEIRPN
jgi:DDE superfamily endonuclease